MLASIAEQLKRGLYAWKVLETSVALTLVLTWFCSSIACALEPTKDLRQYVLRTWTTEQGLPQNTIHAMLQTRDGFLWIGTKGGLARFDGSNFIVYKAGLPNSISGESITGLAEDRDGSLWISSEAGLTQYRNGSFRNFTTRDGLPENSIWRVAEDKAGGVWAVTWRSQLFHFDGKAVHAYTCPFTGRPQDVNAMLEDIHDTLWIGTFHGLFAFDPDRGFRRFDRESGLAGDQVYALALSNRGELWTAGNGGLTQLTSRGFLMIRVPGLGMATLLVFDPSGREDGTIWTGSTGQGLFRVNTEGVQRLRAAQGLISDEIYLLYCSREGSVWLGALNGLNQLSDSAVTSYTTGEGLPNSTLDMQRAQGLNNELWFGRGRFMAHVRDGGLVPLHSMSGEASGALVEPKGLQGGFRGSKAISIWVQSNDPDSRGLVLSEKSGESLLSDGTVSRALPAISWNSVGSMLIAHDGTIWTAGANIGVIAYPVHGPRHAYTTAQGLDSNNVFSLFEDAHGDIWVGTLSGLNRIHNGIVGRIFSCANAMSITSSLDGSLWVSSNSGLIYVPPALTPIRTFTQRDGLPTSFIQGLADDAEGHLWLGTEQGIVRVDKSDLLAPVHRPQSAPVVFGVQDGLRNPQVRINSVFRSRSGDIWFLTLQELGVINPRRIQATSLSPIYIDSVKVDDLDSSHLPISSVEVPAGRRRLTISYALPEFRIPGRIHFRYKLEGWDPDWIEAGTLRNATYTGIPPGHYTFRVVHSDGYGNWSSGESVVLIRVARYFYQTVWFFCLLTVLVLILIWQLHRFRIAQMSARIDARMLERTRIARELHDTLLQGMIGVSMEMYAASHGKFDSASLTAILNRASQRLREVAEQSRKAVEDLRTPSTDSLEATLLRLIGGMNFPDGVQHGLRSVGSPMRLRPLVQVEIERIAREALANVILHSAATFVRLDILYQYAYLFVSISDDGHGMEAELQELERRGHWGIIGMRERAESLGGRLRILRNQPRGTVVEISVPGPVAYCQTTRGYYRSLLRRIVGVRKSD